MQRRFIVTGGAGFIGSNFLHRMVHKCPRDHFVNIDKITYSGNPANVKELEIRSNYQFHKEDICDAPAMERIIQEGDVVVNFAAETHVDNSIIDAQPFLTTNVLGTQVLLNVARKKRAGLFIQISTDEVYGSLSFDQRPSLETDSFSPSSPYSASKAAAEMFCMAAFRTYGQPVIVTRSSNNFGPRQFPEKVIPLFVTNLMEGRKVPLYGEGRNVRDWIYADDNCAAIELVIEKGEVGEAYNIGGGNELTNLELTRRIIQAMNKDESFIEKVADRLGHDLRYSLDCSKIRTLGWSPKFNFDSALRETIDWYEQNPQWWKPLKQTPGKRTT